MPERPSILEVMGIPSGLDASSPAALPPTEALSAHSFPRVGPAESALWCLVGGCGMLQTGEQSETTGSGLHGEGEFRIDDGTAVKILVDAYEDHDAVAKLTDAGVYSACPPCLLDTLPLSI